MENKNTLLTKPIPVLLKDLAIPASTGIIFNTFYNVVDTFYAGLLSTEAVAALSMSFFLYFMIIGVGYGFGSALTALIGNFLGRDKEKLASFYAHKGVFFIFTIGVLMGIIGYIGAESLLKAAGAKESYLPLSLEYINTILFATPFFTTAHGLNAILISKGDTKSYRNTFIVGFFANLALNPLFIFGIGSIEGMGFAGIATSTICVQIGSVIYLAYKAFKTKLLYSTKFYMYAPKPSVYKNIFIQGIPPSLNMLTMSLGSVVTIYFVATYGTEAVAGYGIAFRVEQIMLLPALGISSAVLTLVSNNYGAKLMDRVRETVKLALFYGGVISLLGIVFGYTVASWIVAQFDNNPLVIENAMTYLYIEVFIFFGYVILFVCVSTLQGIKKPNVIFYVGLYRQIIAKVVIFGAIVWWLELSYVAMWYGLFFIIYSAAIFMGWHTKRELQKV